MNKTNFARALEWTWGVGMGGTTLAAAWKLARNKYTTRSILSKNSFGAAAPHRACQMLITQMLVIVLTVEGTCNIV